MKFLTHAVFIILLLLVTFFGLGPVIFADGAIDERIWTAAIVALIYVVLVFRYSRTIKWIKNDKKPRPKFWYGVFLCRRI